ncbi:MAG: tripartite tricarboxylate transporter TctB family protein [Gammaproteobacteria bacterium]|nr:tripartite tricarboxylate transporter TctB family protein [Gammaproteobacteria bacterium]
MKIALTRRFYVALLVALVSAVIFKVSFFQEESEVYLFPSIVSIVMLVLSLVSLSREAYDLCIDDFQPFPFVRQIPAIVMMAGGVALVEVLGMYSSAFLVLLLASFWYSPHRATRHRLLQSLLFSGGFTLFIYLLFSVMLNVQVPRGVLI